MGQYQQWLHYQAIDRRLRAQAETFEAELAQLQKHLDLLEQQEAAPLTENPIFQALVANLHIQNVPPKSTNPYTNGSTTFSTSDLQSSEPGDSISPALLSWGGLPDFGLQDIEEAGPAVEQVPPLTSNSDVELLPEDMMAFFDEHAKTDPQLELPWWLRNIAISSKDKKGRGPIDHNSIRTNRLVQRWIERWGRQSSTTLKPAGEEEESSRE
jgi:hypothetical protein